MKWTILVVVGGLWLVPAVRGQESTATTETTTVMSQGGTDLSAPMFVDDAIPVTTGHLDLRVRVDYLTGDDANGDDDLILGTSLYYGVADRTQLSLDVPFNMGDGRDQSGGIGRFGGNGDVTIGLLHQFMDQSGGMPAMALQTNVKFRTGYRSSPMDLQFRLLMTNEYDSGVRSHINLSTATEDGDFSRWNWDAVVGADGPLCSDGSVRWVMDFAHQNRELNDGGTSTYAEIGTEWTMDNGHTLGMMAQVGLDGHDETADFGARIMMVIPLSN